MAKKKYQNIPTLKYYSMGSTSKKNAVEKQMLSLRLDPKLIDRLKKSADEKGWSLSALIGLVLDEYCQHEDSKKD